MKQAMPHVPIILGGIHATLNSLVVMKEAPFIDFVGVGEGDDQIVDLAYALSKGEDTTNIPNVWCRVDARSSRMRRAR